MIKICSPQLGISPNSSLGGEIYDHQTLKGFALKEIKVLVYLPKDRDYDRSLKNLQVTYCPFKHIVPPWIYSFLCLPYLFSTYKKERFDILRIQSPRFLGLAAATFHLFYPKVPILSSGVTVDSPKIYFWLEKYIYNLSAKIIVQSNYMKNLLAQKYDINPSKIAVTYGGQIDAKITPLKKQPPGIKASDVVVLIMGVLIERKNPKFALSVFQDAYKKNKNLKLIFIGNGPEQKTLQQIVRQENLTERVVFIDCAYGQEKNLWFNRMNIFLFPSQDEGFGLVVTEAMSFAKPVITSNRAAFKEIIKNKKDGFTLPLEGKRLWVETLLKLAGHKKMQKAIGDAAKKKVKREFSWQRTYNLNQQVIKEMIN
jgi:glycosyltransferase involved in cell wall biosynthesis